MAIMLSEVSCLQLFGSHYTAQGHKTHINEVSAARATEVGMGETVNDVFIVVVARARVPSHHLLRLGTQLHHALRHCGTRESTAAESARLIGLCADEGIHVLSIVVGDLGAEEEGQQQKCCQKGLVFYHDYYSFTNLIVRVTASLEMRAI